MTEADIIIIGAGPGGYETALLAARRGLSVILIESGELGGTCLNEGCIPTKSFCRSADILDDLGKAGSFGIRDVGFRFDFAETVSRKDGVVSRLKDGVEALLSHKLINLVKAKAEFRDSRTVMAGGEEFTARNIIVATGSVTKIPDIPGAELAVTSKEMLSLDRLPERLCIIGAGVIGLEFASVFNSFGSKVKVLEYCKEILPQFDSDLAKRLKQVISRRGIDICTQAQVTAISRTDGSLKTDYVLKGNACSIEADIVLMAVGRCAATSSLNFAAAGVDYTPKGVCVNEFMQTNVPHVYAIGDINGKYMLAHAAVYEGIIALDHIMGKESNIDLSVMPSAVFCKPEVASVGLTEQYCKSEGIPYTVRKSTFMSNGKAVCMDETDGFCKVIVSAAEEDRGRILGCHIFGPHASDLIQEATALITRKATSADMSGMIHPHPTLGETLLSAVKDQ